MSEPDYEQLTLFQADSLASHFPSPGSEGARMMTASSGRKWSGLLKKSDPLGSLVKTLLESSEWESTACYLTWKMKGTPHGHYYFRLAASVPRTKDTGLRFWPTPLASDWKNRKKDRRVGLPEAIRMESNAEAGGRLNPEFVEWLMGFPIGWTELDV